MNTHRPDRLELTPIGIVRSPWTEKHSAPRQPAAARGVAGRIELESQPAYLHGLEDLHLWSHVWVLFWFHQNSTWHPKVLPPRSHKKRGVFATRSPHRPNPIGISVLKLERIEGYVLHVQDLDILDGTPVLDIKPYVAYTDSLPAASSGWLDEPVTDPGPRFIVEYTPRAEQQLEWLASRAAFDLRAAAEEVLSVGPSPHPYRRIREYADHFELGVKDFRLHFTLQGEVVIVSEVESGYKARVLDDRNAVATERTPLDVHRAFVQTFKHRS
jgi:tRNA (adenine37-N6)-methyltransferase